MSGQFSTLEEPLSGEIMVDPPHRLLRSPSPCIALSITSGDSGLCLPASVGPPCSAWILPTVLWSGNHPQVEIMRCISWMFLLPGLQFCAAYCFYPENGSFPYFSQSNSCLQREGSHATDYSSRARSGPRAQGPALDGLTSRLAAWLLSWDLPLPPSKEFLFLLFWILCFLDPIIFFSIFGNFFR